MLASADKAVLVADRFNVIVLTSCQILRIFGSRVYNIALSTGRRMQLGILRKKFICARSRCRLMVLFRGEFGSICVMSHCIRRLVGQVDVLGPGPASKASKTTWGFMVQWSG